MIVYTLNCVVDCYLLLQQAWIFIKPPGKINFKKQSILQVFGPKNKTLQINFIKGISYNKDIDFVVMSISKYSTPPCLEVAGFSYEFHKLGTFHIAFFLGVFSVTYRGYPYSNHIFEEKDDYTSLSKKPQFSVWKWDIMFTLNWTELKVSIIAYVYAASTYSQLTE